MKSNIVLVICSLIAFALIACATVSKPNYEFCQPPVETTKINNMVLGVQGVSNSDTPITDEEAVIASSSFIAFGRYSKMKKTIAMLVRSKEEFIKTIHEWPIPSYSENDKLIKIINESDFKKENVLLIFRGPAYASRGFKLESFDVRDRQVEIKLIDLVQQVSMLEDNRSPWCILLLSKNLDDVDVFFTQSSGLSGKKQEWNCIPVVSN